MGAVNTKPRDEREAETNWRSLNEALDELYNGIDGLPGIGLCSGTSVFLAGATSTELFTNYPNGVTSHWDQKVRVRPRWQRMAFLWRLSYTSPLASVNTFSITLSIAGERQGTITTAALPTLWTTTLSLAGPAVAGEELVHQEVVTASTISTYYEYLRIRVSRNDPDANANDLRVLGYRIGLLPA